MNDNLRGSLFMVLAMLGFAVEDAFFKAATATGGVSAGLGTILFGTFGTAFFLLYALWTREPILRRAYIEGPLLIRSAFEILGRLFFALSLAFAPLSTTSSILQAAPLVVTLGAALVLKEKVGPRRWVAMMIGFAGVLMILRPTPSGFDATAIFAVLGMIGFAGRDLMTRASPPEVSATQLGILGFLMVFIAGVVITLFETAPPSAPTIPALSLLLGTGLAGLVGYSALTKSMRTGEVSVVAPFRYARLLIALVFAFVLFGERPDAVTLIGAALIVGSGVYTLMRSGRKDRAGSAPRSGV
ncbi:DMT family transporter [Marivita geojedonensis]|uniref:Membrane protein n=1 Tax=Marivita geojedonensis TaxID=1123756 RepID=A0A1X4NQF6_9RHOB|nr:DMT family transporter [Marivita geojedonensis]OSQ53183.1 membrane protein [Marivita geojedonensis]PRY81878.1 drug/metabolite transporter (DMT)-like permease [Marivita geojedonensis]